MVPEVFDFGPDGDDFYIAMELVEGPSLEERLADRRTAVRRSRRPRTVALRVPRSRARFLRNHRATSLSRLLHNDLKPAHLKIPDTGERKVLDFGMAKVLEEATRSRNGRRRHDRLRRAGAPLVPSGSTFTRISGRSA